ncbi:sigma-E processing peptidase SpoIIGA [Salipaludibacillus keqinensis]|uniref:Sporulation sigma-E factor-processing peptidase n=1 Tax=Salipaludibacillus keqinensis TaxID=2045207 RepID=A0A323TF62_9BACI|nr:sigma-E processing peptidase SpoIIGA [Salipaludibacillus keqinensis]PYZ93230.1 sigma-E processing peptidase SpoIIGA [Salipaludibacillus keqinensis]
MVPLTLYLDVIWMLNFFIDLLLLLLTSIVLKKNVSKKRLFLGALFASMYIWFLFIPSLQVMTHPLMKGIYSVFIILITFRFHQIRSFVQALLMFYFVNFAVGGGLIGLHFFLQMDSSFIHGTFATRGSGFGSPISWLFVLIGFPLIFIYSKQRFDSVESVKIRYDETMDVIVSFNDSILTMKGFVDSGNQLTDPFTKKPVMIIDMKETKDQFPQDLYNFSMEEAHSASHVPPQYQGKLSIVPYRTIGTDQQFLWTLRPDKVTVYENGKAYDCSKTLLGLSHLSLGEKGEYHCLLNPKMFQNSKSVI